MSSSSKSLALSLLTLLLVASLLTIGVILGGAEPARSAAEDASGRGSVAEQRQTHYLASRIPSLARSTAKTDEPKLEQGGQPESENKDASAPTAPGPQQGAQPPATGGDRSVSQVQTQSSTKSDNTSNQASTQDNSIGENKSKETRPSLSARASRTEDVPKEPEKTVSEKPLSMEERFINSIAEQARLSQQATGVPASVTIAQAMLESDYGRSGLAREANNFFGIKAKSKPGPAGVVLMNTWESINGKNITVKEPFRAYNNMLESFIDHGMFFVENARYAIAMQNAADARKFARLIHQAGYATDPNYSDKLIALMDKFNLYVHDLTK